MSDLTKVKIKLPDTFDAELLWAESKGNHLFRLVNIPFDAIGYAEGDIVRCIEIDSIPEVIGIEKDSGNGTLHLVFVDSNLPESQRVLNELVSVGCTYERASKSLVGVTIPPALLVPFSQIANYLNGIDDGILQGWEVAKRFIRANGNE